MELNNIIFSLLLVFFNFFLSKYLLLKFNRDRLKILSDDQFKKPQAFHESSTYRLGGLIFFCSLILTFLYLFYFKNIYHLEYLSFCTLFFIIGFMDDLKINLKPKLRLLLMIVFISFLVVLNNFYVTKTGIEFLNRLLEIDIFSLMFTSLCFLFIVTGSNLIDGFNGLLGIQSLIIFIVLMLINIVNGNNELVYILFFLSLLTLIFLKFNFPRAEIFLGDGGAYLIGIAIDISIVKTSILNPFISPFFFCILLFYLFFEVFFSFFRKAIFLKKNPLFPDDKHLHMCLYKYLFKNNNNKLKSNYMVSTYINFLYFLAIIPGIVFMKNGFFCKYYFLFVLILYIFFYKTLYAKMNKY